MNGMNASFKLRLLTREDLPFADSVRALASWNQTIADWERFLAAEPGGCFLAEWNGARAGTATTIVYGPALAWIGMVLVHPDHRRRGIGRALLEHCIEHLRKRGVRCLKLDATPAGKKVYDALSFKDEWTLTRWEHAVAHWPNAKTPSGITACRDFGAVEMLDAAAFGISRRRILGPLMEQSRCAAVYETEARKVAGYGLLRDGSSALYLGPVVAASADAGASLVNTLLSRAGERKIYWDIPDQNVAAVALARELGFAPQRTLTRMYLGENAAPGNPLHQFAIAGPEVG
jgi:ribosomal protein S18 acetylase RimI-like enzyme